MVSCKLCCWQLAAEAGTQHTAGTQCVTAVVYTTDVMHDLSVNCRVERTAPRKNALSHAAVLLLDLCVHQLDLCYVMCAAQVDLVTCDALQQLLQWGIAKQDASGCFRLVGLQAAVEALRAQALRSISSNPQQQQQQQTDIPHPPSPAAQSVQFTADHVCMSDSTDMRSGSSSNHVFFTAGVDVPAAVASSSRLHTVSSHQQQQRCGSHGQRWQQQCVPRQYQCLWGVRCAHTSSSSSRSGIRHSPQAVLRVPRVSVARQQLAAGLSCCRGVL
jgi:hypothetical protein